MTKKEEIIKILKNYTTLYKCLNAVPEDRIIIEDHFEEIAELIAKVISLNPPVMRSAFSAGEAYQLWHNDKLEEEQPDFDEWMKKHFT